MPKTAIAAAVIAIVLGAPQARAQDGGIELGGREDGGRPDAGRDAGDDGAELGKSGLREPGIGREPGVIGVIPGGGGGTDTGRFPGAGARLGNAAAAAGAAGGGVTGRGAAG